MDGWIDDGGVGGWLGEWMDGQMDGLLLIDRQHYLYMQGYEWSNCSIEYLV